MIVKTIYVGILLALITTANSCSEDGVFSNDMSEMWYEGEYEGIYKYYFISASDANEFIKLMHNITWSSSFAKAYVKDLYNDSLEIQVIAPWDNNTYKGRKTILAQDSIECCGFTMTLGKIHYYKSDIFYPQTVGMSTTSGRAEGRIFEAYKK